MSSSHSQEVPNASNDTPNPIYLNEELHEVEVHESETNTNVGTGNEVESQGSQQKSSQNKPPPHTRKARVSSSVWEHFKREIISKDNVKAVCNYCEKKLSGHYKNGTSHLRLHYENCPRRKQLTLKQAILKAKKKVDGDCELETFVPDNFDKRIAREKIVELVVMHELPLSFVEYEAFRNLMNYVQPLVGSMSRNTMKKEIFKLYEVEKSKARMALEKCDSRIAITTDMWTSDNQKKGYMVVTAHFIDNSWQIQSRILRFLYVPSPHGSEALCSALIKCLMDWNVDHRLSTVTVDNCSTNDAMIEILLRRLNIESMILRGKFIHMRCCAHILNLIVKSGMEVIDSGIEKIRDSVTFWTATPKRIERFEEVAKLMRVPYSRKLVLDCKTRWNSTYLMLTTAIEYKEVFSRMKQCEPQYKCLPYESEWKLASTMCDHLSTFYKLTEIFSGTKYPTANLFFPLICDIRVSMYDWLGSPYEEIRRMADKMIEKFKKYWDVIYGVLAVAIVLDPRYKKLYLKFALQKIYGEDDAYFQMEKILDLCKQLESEYKSKASTSSSSVPLEKHNDSSSVDTALVSGRYVKRTKFDSEWESFKVFEQVLDEKSELDLYLDEKAIADTEDFDILTWWKTNRGRYPILSKIVKDIMAIPVSTVASESAFSTSGRHLSPHRSRLHPDTLEALMCTQNWLWTALRAIIPENEILTGEEILEDDEGEKEGTRSSVTQVDLDLEEDISPFD